MIKNVTGKICLDNCQKTENSLRYYDFVDMKCKMCNNTIPGCNKCSNEELHNEPLCKVCDAGLFPTFDKKKCTICENDWEIYDEENDECLKCSDIFPFCGRCSFDEGEFVCHECLGSTKYMPPVDEILGVQACGCEAVQYVAWEDNKDYDSAYCDNCLNAIPGCNTCHDDGSGCIECRDGFYETEDFECSADPCAELDDLGTKCLECNLNHQNGITLKT